jgi:hypothetical protein
MSQYDSTFSALKTRFDPEEDTLKDKLADQKQWRLEGNVFRYTHQLRPPPSQETAFKAIAYIRALTSKYPFQLRKVIALPLWDRFQEVWCDTGDEEKSLRSI